MAKYFPRVLRHIFLFNLLFSMGLTSVKAQAVSNDNLSHAFSVGEEITYVLSYTWLFIWTDVGEVRFKVQSDTQHNPNLLHLHVFGTSYPFYDWFFKVRDVYESWVEPSTLIPLRFNRNINEGGYAKENEYDFNWKSNEVNARIRRRGSDSKFYTIPVEPETVDLVTAIYITRNLDFSKATPMTSYPVSIILDREIYNVKYIYLAKETIRVKGIGEFKTLKFRVELVAGDVFKEGQYLYVWVSDDANKIPIYIESPIKVGSVKARLSGWKGLSSPLNSKIN